MEDISGEDSAREAAVIARCSMYAAQYIRQLRGHPLYRDVLARLEAVDHQLFELDVEHAFYESLRAECNRAEAQPDTPGNPKAD